MRECHKPREILLVAVAAVAMAAVVCGCPLGLVLNAQMTQMMGHDMGAQGLDGTCPALCGVLPSSPRPESNGSVLGPLPVHPAPNAASNFRPIFHPPTST
jgi:hypothetical protein